MHQYLKKLVWLSAILSFMPTAFAQDNGVDYEAGFTANTGKGETAPYYIASNRGGTLTQKSSALVNAAIKHDMDTTRRFSWGAGAEVWAGWSSSLDYKRYDIATGEMKGNSQHPARAWVQQLYGEVKYRSLFLTLGQKEINSPLVNKELSSGDLIMSGNARPGAGVNAGFVNFQNIPFTKGWVQIWGQMGYYRLSDGDWIKNHYNYLNNSITTGYWFNYKAIQFRTKPTQPVVLTIGAQASCQFAGTQQYYENGVLTKTVEMPANAKAFFRALIAGSGGTNSGDSFVEGNHVGSWDIAVEYKMNNHQRIRAYYQIPWEDGSGIGKQNGWDGLYGLEWHKGSKGIVNGAVIEYIDLTNQSGHVHWALNDQDGSPLTGKGLSGSDDYYNNYCYNGYQNHGMSFGSPFVKSTLYNTDGYLRYTDNLMRGFHMGVTGNITDEVDYRLLFSYRKAWGTPEHPRANSVHDTSFLLEAIYRPNWMKAFTMKAQFAFDRGNLYSNNTGGLVSIVYHGNFNLRK